MSLTPDHSEVSHSVFGLVMRSAAWLNGCLSGVSGCSSRFSCCRSGKHGGSSGHNRLMTVASIDQIARFERFRQLHSEPEIFVIPNPWDAGSARLLAALGFPALATTSAGLAFSLGRKDMGGGVTRQDVLDNARAIVEATDLPVSADLQNGFADHPAECSATVLLASRAGLVGGSIEDASGNPERPIYDFQLAVERIAAAKEAARPLPFVLTARAENYLWGQPDLDDTICRLRAYSDAGADVLYAPGLPTLAAVREVCTAITKPVNVVMGLKGPAWSLEQLQEAGVKRVSVGGSFARAALTGLLRAAREVREHGTFGYATETMTHAEATGFMRSSDDEQST